MFGKNKIKNRMPESEYGIKMGNGEMHYVDSTAYEYIKHLQEENGKLKVEKHKLKMELAAIQPIVAIGKLKPAISTNCNTCIYCINSSWNKSIVSCCKDNVCADYKMKEA